MSVLMLPQKNPKVMNNIRSNAINSSNQLKFKARLTSSCQACKTGASKFDSLLVVLMVFMLLGQTEGDVFLRLVGENWKWKIQHNNCLKSI